MVKDLNSRSIPWFSICLLGIFLLSAALRFWGLNRFNSLVFDEVYYAKFANDYLTGTKFFNAHPPLSQYIIAIGIWLGSHMPFGNDVVNSLTGSVRSPFSYRWFNALTGSFMPLVVAAVAYQLKGNRCPTHTRRTYAIIAALFSACDGLFLVDSRYALNNIYLDILGLLGQLFLLLALTQQGRKRWVRLAIAGVFFGASASIKWNGLWFLLGVYLIWITAWLMRWTLGNKQQDLNAGNREGGEELAVTQSLKIQQLPLQNLTQLNLVTVLSNLAIIPILVYSVIWIPHLLMNPTPGFLGMQKEILLYHERIGDGPQVHPYCSKWYTWPLMIRPVAYYYQTVGKIIYDVHAMSNPILLWLSTAAILLLLLLLVQRFLAGSGWKYAPTPSTWIALYLVVNYAANLLPWMRVTRCTFFYHYMGASIFAELALAWIVSQWLNSPKKVLRGFGVSIVFWILLAFVFWMPIYLGLPLDSNGFSLRIWNTQFSNWI